MTPPEPRRALAVVAVLLAAAARADDSIRCDGGIVSVGDSKLDLVGKCGWPALREAAGARRAAVLRERLGAGVVQRTVTTATERWTYDFGPSRFIGVAVLEMGRVVAIERGGYGYERAAAEAGPSPPRARCDTTFHEGESSYEVLARCGEPAFRDVRVEERVRLVDDRAPVLLIESVTVTVELWTYDFGPRTFARLLTFEDGRLVRVETGAHGYAR